MEQGGQGPTPLCDIQGVCSLMLGGQHWCGTGRARTVKPLNAPDKIGQVQESCGVLAGSAAQPSTTVGATSCVGRLGWQSAGSAESCSQPESANVAGYSIAYPVGRNREKRLRESGSTCWGRCGLEEKVHCRSHGWQTMHQHQRDNTNCKMLSIAQNHACSCCLQTTPG